MPDVRRRDEAGLNHVAHEKVANPFRILPVGLVALLWLGVLGMSQCDLVVLFEDIEHGNPILARRLHANLVAGIQRKPFIQLPEPFGKGREAGLLVLRAAVCVGDADTGVNPGLVDIESAAILAKDFEHGVPPVKENCKVGRDWLSGEIEPTSEEISLRATVLRHSLMPLRTADTI